MILRNTSLNGKENPSAIESPASVQPKLFAPMCKKVWILKIPIICNLLWCGFFSRFLTT